MKFKFEIINKDNKIKAVSEGENEVNMVYENKYEEGDKIIFKCDTENTHIHLQLDEVLGKSMVYMNGKEIIYTIPFGEKCLNISPKAFGGNVHLLSAKVGKDFEIEQYRNLSLNVNDQNGEEIYCYPHASANIETRGEVVFAARNVIDGTTANKSHGNWPYESWGINQREDAQLMIDFGRKIKTDRIILYTRADFPHDNWWEKGKLSFSDGSNMEIELKKTCYGQEFIFKEKEVEWIKLDELIKSPDESPFPALTAMEVYGREI